MPFENSSFSKSSKADTIGQSGWRTLNFFYFASLGMALTLVRGLKQLWALEPRLAPILLFPGRVVSISSRSENKKIGAKRGAKADNCPGTKPCQGRPFLKRKVLKGSDN